MPDLPDPDRRHFCFAAGLTTLATAALSPRVAHALVRTPERRLHFRHLHTGEVLRTTYCVDGAYVETELRAVDHFMRDWRTGEVKAIDPALLDLLFVLRNRLETREPYHVICGYRSPKTNEMLRRTGHAVAKHSLHLEGRAVDIRVPDRRLSVVRRVAVSLRGGGVGYYPKSNFVHLDTGRVRYW